MKKSIITLIIFAFALNSCGIFRKTETHPDPRTHDEGEGVVINGVRWATRNVDMPGTFAENPESSGLFYMWGRREAWTAENELLDERYFSGLLPRRPSGHTWERRYDPCPPGWRVPTSAELYSLRDVDREWVSKNGVNGLLFGTAPNQLFLPATGYRILMPGSGNVIQQNHSGWYWFRDMPVDEYDHTRVLYGFIFSFHVMNTLGNIHLGTVLPSLNSTLVAPVRCVSIN